MKTNSKQDLINTIDKVTTPLQPHKYQPLLEKIGDARFVLMGEATHGSHEFYEMRAELTQELIQRKNFMAVCIEGDWPAVYRFHRYIQGATPAESWRECFAGFNHFPKWMWCNQDIPPFLRWLRNYNDTLAPEKKVGFYGLDLYSLYASMQEVIDYLSRVDPEASVRAKERYACFENTENDPQNYGYLTNMGTIKSCVNEAVAQLQDLVDKQHRYLLSDSFDKFEEHFYATQNARLVKNAEHYYRAMFESRASTWNIRDTHMAETVAILNEHLKKRVTAPPKFIIWAHNSHVGDARATEMGASGEINLGQLLREMFPNETFHLGFSTYTGTVTAADEWDQPPEIKQINPGLNESYEDLFHHCQYKNFVLDLHDEKIKHFLQLSRLQRAIGVIYKPQFERQSHYFFTHLPQQFDALVHIDKTSAVIPLESEIV